MRPYLCIIVICYWEGDSDNGAPANQHIRSFFLFFAECAANRSPYYRPGARWCNTPVLENFIIGRPHGDPAGTSPRGMTSATGPMGPQRLFKDRKAALETEREAPRSRLTKHETRGCCRTGWRLAVINNYEKVSGSVMYLARAVVDCQKLL